MKFWPLKKIAMFSSPPFTTFHGKREAGSFSVFTSTVNCLVSSLRLDSLWTLHAHQHLPESRSTCMVMTLIFYPILTSSCHIFLLSLLLQLTPVCPCGCYWQVAMNTSQISKHCLCNGPMTANCRLVVKIRLRNNARSVQLQDSAWSRADAQQVALLSPSSLPAHEHASFLTAQTQNSKSHSDRVLSERALAIS